MGFTTHPHRFHLLLILLLVAGAGRIIAFWFIYSVEPARIVYPDSASYLNTARALLETGRFAVHPDMPNTPQVIRTPGYPLFIAGIFSLWENSCWMLLVLQIVISIATIGVTYCMAAALWNERIALLAALLVALDLPSFLLSQTILTETLFTFLLASALSAVIYGLRSPSHHRLWAFAAGLLFSCATLTRPILYYAIWLIAPVFAILTKHDKTVGVTDSRQPAGPVSQQAAGDPTRTSGVREKHGRLSLLFACILPWLVLVGGWQMRNYLSVGSSDFSQIQGINLLFYRGAAILAQQQDMSFAEARERLGYHQYTELHPETATWTQAKLNAHWKQKGLRLIVQHPFTFLTIQAKGAFKMLFGPGETSLLDYLGSTNIRIGPARALFTQPLDHVIQTWFVDKPGLLTVFFLVYLYLVLLYGGVFLSVRSFLRSFKQAEDRQKWKTRGIHFILWGIILYLLFISAGPEAYSRFRVPLMPLLSLYAAHGLDSRLRREQFG